MEIVADKVYNHNIFNVLFDLNAIKSGIYHVKGNLGEVAWREVCARGDIAGGAGCDVDLVFNISARKVIASGTIVLKQIQKTCRRSLTTFYTDDCYEVDDEILGDPEAVYDDDNVLQQGVFSVAEFIMQQIIISQEPYPVNPDIASESDSFADVGDGLREADLKKNPFSVLKDLKVSKK